LLGLHNLAELGAGIAVDRDDSAARAAAAADDAIGDGDIKDPDEVIDEMDDRAGF
jgi:hypothetical protein